jgi:hypothetical protein
MGGKRISKNVFFLQSKKSRRETNRPLITIGSMIETE